MFSILRKSFFLSRTQMARNTIVSDDHSNLFSCKCPLWSWGSVTWGTKIVNAHKTLFCHKYFNSRRWNTADDWNTVIANHETERKWVTKENPYPWVTFESTFVIVCVTWMRKWWYHDVCHTLYTPTNKSNSERI